MRFILIYGYHDWFDNVSDDIGGYNTIKEAMDDARHWNFRKYKIYDEIEDRLIIDYNEDE